jgi:hypothetical protein
MVLASTDSVGGVMTKRDIQQIKERLLVERERVEQSLYARKRPI